MKAKLVIWDLDDTLWKGSLAEGDDVEVFDDRVDLIKALNACGVVNSICSKNDFHKTKAVLEKKGLWDLFVFPEIAFEPKGALVQRIIKDMQLRASDVIFIDDNHLNLREVEYANSSIRVVDAKTDEVADLLCKVAQAYSGKKKSRVEEYRILERKRGDARALALGSNEAFLATCEIKVCIVERTGNLRFAQRIEELINRTNQLNFLKTRVLDGSMPEYITQSTKHETFSVFVWDKYGYYGLVGFASVENKKQLAHFTFSCRVMNMGIEAALVSFLRLRFPRLADTPVAAIETPWIQYLTADSPEFTAVSGQDESGESLPVRIMANCQSGSIAHYMGLSGVSWDNWPHAFRLSELFKKGTRDQSFKALSIYGAFNDYNPTYWATPPTAIDYQRAVELFVESIPEDGAAIVLLPPEKFSEKNSLQSPALYAAFNKIWREAAKENSQLAVVDVYEIEPFPAILKDARHYTPEQLLSVSKRLRKMVDGFLATGRLDKPEPRYRSDRLAQMLEPYLLRVGGQAWCVFAEPNVRLSDVEIQGTVYVGFSSIMLSGVVRSYVEVGRYCSIGRNVILGADSFRDGGLSGSPFFDFVVERNAEAMVSLNPKRRTIIGNDCRIGDGAVVASGVVVGHGAVVMPNAFVDRDVAPYEIVAGNGTTVGYRFDAEIRSSLLGLSWWDKDPNVVRTLASFSPNDVFNALSGYFECLEFPKSYRQFRSA